MLSELYEKLGIEGEMDPAFLKSAIFSDELWAITWRYSGIPFEAQESPRVVTDVVNILDMWSFIEESYERFSEEEKQLLERDAEPFGRNPEFLGFDGNYETDHFGTALFMVNDLNRFSRFKGRSLNSHSPSLTKYHRMLSVFLKIRPKLGPDLMSVEQLAAVLKARAYSGDE